LPFHHRRQANVGDALHCHKKWRVQVDRLWWWKNDGSVKNSPFPLTVFPHLPCASTSTAAGSALSLVTVGRAEAFTVHARDEFYNRRGSQVGDNYAAFFRAPGQASAMNTVYVTTYATGVFTIAATRGGSTKAITGVTKVNGGAGYSSTPKLATAGCASTTTQLANLVAVMHADGYIVSVTVVPGGAGYTCTPSIQILGGRDSVWSSSAKLLLDIKLEYKQLGASASIKLTETLSGTTAVIPSTRLFRNREIYGSPFPPMSVQPAPTCAFKSSVRGQGLTSATAGVPSMFTIQSNDQYFNKRGIGGDLYVVRLQVGGLLPRNRHLPGRLRNSH
jgi:hypothetical protein